MSRAWYNLKFIIRKALELIKIPFFMLFDSLAYFQSAPVQKNGTLILRCDAIGDYILFRNFIRHYEAAFGKDTFFLIREPLAILYQKLDQIENDRLILFNPSKFEVNLIYRLNVLRRIRKTGFERIIQVNFSRYFFIEDCLVRLSGAVQKIGINGSDNNIGRIPRLLASGFYTEYNRLSEEIQFEFLRNREIAELICKKNIDQVLETKVEYEKRPTVVLAPGAGASYRRWSPGYFIELIHLLNEHSKTDFKIIGSNEDQPMADRIISQVSSDISILSLCGKIDLYETIEQIAGSSMLITNESGPAHMGAATGTKTFCISNGNHLGRFHPYPSSMKMDIFHIYPDELEQALRTVNLRKMEKQLKFRSVYNIDTIPAQKVFERIMELS